MTIATITSLIGVASAACVALRSAKLLARRRLKLRCLERRALLLSFDDGPGPRLTARVLDMLDADRSRATFFLLGSRATAAPGVVDRIARAGHEIGCHTSAHLHAWRTSPAKALRDIGRGYETLSSWIGPDAVFRPPYGKMTWWTWMALKRRGAPIAFWTIDSGDTWQTPPDPQSIADRAVRDGGGVVLLHDFDRGPERERFVLRTTELLLATARREGLTVCTFSDLIGREIARPSRRSAERDAEELAAAAKAPAGTVRTCVERSEFAATLAQESA
jgi:peptidoglycan-N-acetylglucosamine deacetylase